MANCPICNKNDRRCKLTEQMAICANSKGLEKISGYLPKSQHVTGKGWVWEPARSVQVASFEEQIEVSIDAAANSHYRCALSSGLQYIKIDKTGQKRPEVFYVGDYLKAIAMAHSPNKDEYRIQVEFNTPKGMRTLTIRKLLFEGEGKDALELLVDNGYWYNRDSRKILLSYLCGLGKNADLVYIVSEKTGWVQNGFVLPDRCFGDPMLRFQQVELPQKPVFDENGTLKEWKDNVAEMALNNSRLTFAIGVALSAPLNPILSVESGGWHLYGSTSGGKTATLKVAGSVYGSPKNQVSTWRATSNSLEFKAAARNNLCLLLDEIGQAIPQAAAEAAYMLANGQGKSRLRKDLSQRNVLTWDLVFLSTGEHTLSGFLEQGGISTKGGQENRMPSIPICPTDDRNSAFEQHMGLEPVDFVKQLERSCEKYTGTAFTAFMTHLVAARTNEYDAKLIARHTEIRDDLVNGHGISNVLFRVADRMASVQLALEIACEIAVIPHSLIEVSWAIKTVFDDWVADRGGEKDFELMRQCDKIYHLFVINEFSDRLVDVNGFDEGDRVTRNLLAYKHNNGFLVPSVVFSSPEFRGEINLSVFKKELIARSWLVPAPDGRADSAPRIGKKTRRGYFFRRFWSEEQENT